MSTQLDPELSFPDEPLDLGQFIPYFVCGISNRWTNLSSRLYKGLFGIGIVEWRILGYLGSPKSAGTASASDIAQDLGLDEALVSRAKQSMIDQGFISYDESRRAGRYRPVQMTQAGLHLFERVRDLALARQEQLLAGLGEEDRATFLRLLQHVHMRLPDLVAMDRNMLKDAAGND